MLSEVLKTLEAPTSFWAGLTGASPSQMEEWLSGQREVPVSVADRLAKATGVPAEVLRSTRKLRVDARALLPPLWLRARAQGLGEPEHRAIAVARLLAARYDEVLSLTEPPAEPSFRALFDEVRKAVDLQAPAEEQGRAAAETFLRLTTLDRTATGIGEVFRGYLRAYGVVILETPIASKKLEGFCVPVGMRPAVRPCLLANGYRTTWFRRNYVLLHELCHAIFDLQGTAAVFDAPSDAVSPDYADTPELRADAFALHTLLPRRILATFESRFGHLSRLDSRGLARAVSYAHAELPLILRAAVRHGLLTEPERAALTQTDVAKDLREISPHAKRIEELDQNQVDSPELLPAAVRKSTFPIPDIRLPIPYVRLVLEALAARQIVVRKAAELLMIRPSEFAERYPSWARDDDDDQ